MLPNFPNPLSVDHPEWASVNLAKIARHPSCRAPLAAVAFGTCLVGSRAAAAEPSADPECLTITQSSAATYMIANTACPDKSVLASIELAANGDLARCFTKKIRSQISIASENAAPIINYQCIEGTKGCSVEELRGMFPECHAG